MAAEIIQIDNQDLTTQIYSGQDVNLISSFDIDTTLTSGSYIEYFTYDLNQNLLSTDYNFTQYSVTNDGQSAGSDNSLSQITLNPEQSLINSGFDQGSYIACYNFLNKKIGSNIEQLYISEISSDRTEIRLDSTILSDLDIIEDTNTFIQERTDSTYFLDFYLNFGDNQLIIANNIELDNQDPTNSTILVKLYEPLPFDFDLNSTLWVVTSIEESIAYQINFEDEPIIIQDTTPISGPNFNLDIKGQVNNSTIELSYSDLISTSLTSSKNQLNSLLEEKEIDINIDYTNFSDFIHFSSAQTRLENFKYKLGLIEQYSSSIAVLNNTNSSSIAVGETTTVLENKIDNIITNFDGYDYYLYYNSSSYAWPKTNTEPPYQLATINSTEAINWFNNIIDSASLFDNSNKDNLLFTIPEYLRDNPDNNQYELFIDMVAQHFDNIWIYYKDVTQKYNADNRLEQGISKDIVADAIRDFGIKLYQNNFSNDDLYTAFLGLTPEGGLFPFPNITGSLPTPSGFEYIDTFISASNDYLPLDDVNKSLYKRIYHNLPYLLKSKGTLPGLRALITSYGIPDTILRINEYGGKDKVEGNDWDYWKNEFNYSLSSPGNSPCLETPFNILNPLWNASNNTPEALIFRFKLANTDPENGDSERILTLDSDLELNITYTGSGLSSGSYNGSIIDPYYQYATLTLFPDINNSSVSASVYLPFYNQDWWSVMINAVPNDNDIDYTLYASNKIYEGGNNGTALGFFQSSSISYPFDTWKDATTAFYGTSMSGSFQELRYYTNPISESVFKDYVMNPYSIEGNSLNSGPNELAFRAPLGGELYTENISIHPKVTGSWAITSSWNGGSSGFSPQTAYEPNEEYFFYDQPVAGIKNAISDKIRLENDIIPSGNTLSPFRRLNQQSETSASYTQNTNLLEVAFSPQDEINDDINSSIGYFNIGDFIGDPSLRTNPVTSYPALDKLRNEYFEKYTKNYDLTDFIRLIKFFDNSLFKMIQNFVPARTSLAAGIIIKQHVLERNRYPQQKINTSNLDISGTLKPQWNDYNPGTVENFSGGAGGSFNMFNNVLNVSQSWVETNQTILGPVNTIHSSQDEFYNGEFSGSMITVTTQSLAQAYPLDLTGLKYNSSGSTSTTPTIGSFTWQTDLNKQAETVFVSSLYINEITSNGINIKTALANLSSGNNITFTISGSIEDFPMYPPTPIQYIKTFNGLITSISYISSGIWNIQLSNNISNAAIIGLVDPINYINYPSTLNNSDLFLVPFINDISNYYNSDFNPLINNAVDNRKSTIYQDIDYSQGALIPVNFNLLINNEAEKSTVQDSNYTLTRHINPRYNGSKSTSQNINFWTKNDIGTYGKTPTAQSLKTTVAYCDVIGGYTPDKMNASAAVIKYLINEDGTVTVPNTSENSLFSTQNTFITDEKIIISTNSIGSGDNQYRNIIKGGYRIEPILYTQIGHSPASWSPVTMSFTTDFVSDLTSVDDYQATSLPASSTPPTIPTASFGILDFGNNIYLGSGASNWNVNEYTINQDLINEDISLTIEGVFTLYLQHPIFGAQNHIVTINLVRNRGGVETILDTKTVTNNKTDYPSPGITDLGIEILSHTLNPQNMQNGDKIYFKGVYITSTYGPTANAARYVKGESSFRIKQSPAPTNVNVTSSGTNTIWGYPDNTKLFAITASNSTLSNLYNKNFTQTSITGSGFQDITLPWNLKIGDEFRFEGNESNTFMVKDVFAAEDNRAGRISPVGKLEVHFNNPLPSSSINLDHFLIRRYVEDPGVIIFEGFRPNNSSGPYIIKPEYVVPELDKNVDDFILDLTEKGLL